MSSKHLNRIRDHDSGQYEVVVSAGFCSYCVLDVVVGVMGYSDPVVHFYVPIHRPNLEVILIRLRNQLFLVGRNNLSSYYSRVSYRDCRSDPSLCFGVTKRHFCTSGLD